MKTIGLRGGHPMIALAEAKPCGRCGRMTMLGLFVFTALPEPHNEVRCLDCAPEGEK